MVALCLVLLAGCMSLDAFLFEPTQVGEYLRPEDMDSDWHVRWVIPDSLIETVSLQSENGNTIYGFFVQAQPDTGFSLSVPTVLYCHGRGENINRYWGRVELLWEMGYNVFIFDYQGYGKSEGSASGEACYADARAALDYVRGRGDVDTTKVVYYGWSLGSFVATYLAADVRRPAALVLENPIASTSALAKEGSVLAIPGSFVAKADFDNERRIPLVDARVMIVYGKKDVTAVPKWHAEVLIEKAKGKVPELKVEVVAEADHSDLPEVMGYPTYRKVVSDFIGR